MDKGIDGTIMHSFLGFWGLSKMWHVLLFHYNATANLESAKRDHDFAKSREAQNCTLCGPRTSNSDYNGQWYSTWGHLLMLRVYHWYKVRGPPQLYSARFYSGSCVWGEANLASFLELVEHRAAHLQCPTKDLELAGVPMQSAGMA